MRIKIVELEQRHAVTVTLFFPQPCRLKLLLSRWHDNVTTMMEAGGGQILHVVLKCILSRVIVNGKLRKIRVLRCLIWVVDETRGLKNDCTRIS